ncbi:MAG: hypothetical protein U0998_04755 [Moraxellaceae bacterium]|nr:hypothetical protein [Moraxellaceae bacterium]MDP1776602.1 hypothetical protein [Moraxellaceae bacterium]MDZ4297011.1 hypothetical protein [Moraxellaceae bacterium]MDZ4386519.1 hypothetical protein [Moraxellaceae bacterium]
MRALSWVLLALIVVVALISLISQDAGYVLISWRVYTLELTLTTLLIAVMLTSWSILQLIRLSYWLTARDRVQFADEIDTKPANRG